MPPPELDLNCDLGEGESPERTLALLGLVDSANIATGGHAGDEDSMRRCLAGSRRFGVHAGAHPGLPSRADFGRGSPASVSARDLQALLSDQVARFAGLAAELNVPFHHLKLHGALYHAVESSPALARACLEFVGRTWPGLLVYARAGGAVQAASAQVPAVTIWPEGFLDRGYADDGTLVPRGAPGSILHNPEAIRQRLRDLRDRGGLRTATGRWLPLQPRTLCIHGDSPRAIECLREIRNELPRRPPMPTPPSRCPWCQGSELYERYHDEEWGVPVHDDRRLFEMLILEGAQAGLSWLTVLKKRENYRRAYHDFDLAAIARFGPRDEARLLGDEGIIRHRLKIAASIGNARAALAVQREFGSLEAWLWSHVNGQPLQNRRRTMAEVPARTPESDALSRALLERGFKFVGSTICYAFMQAVGMVNDHLVDCPRHAALAAPGTPGNSPFSNRGRARTMGGHGAGHR